MTETEFRLCRALRHKIDGQPGNRLLFDGVRRKIHLVGLQREGLVICGDMDRAAEMIQDHLRTHGETRNTDPTIHFFSWNGGGARLVRSPMNPLGNEDIVFMREILDIVPTTVKDLEGISLYGHWPCGKAGLAGMNMLQVIEAQMAAKVLLKREFPGKKVACFFHVDYYEHCGRKMRTYFLQRRKWETWKKQVGISISLEEPMPLPEELIEQLSKGALPSCDDI